MIAALSRVISNYYYYYYYFSTGLFSGHPSRWGHDPWRSLKEQSLWTAGVKFLYRPYATPVYGLQSQTRFLNLGIRESLIPEPAGITGIPGLEIPQSWNMGLRKCVRDCKPFAIISMSHIRKLNYFHCIFGNDCCSTINRIWEK